MKKIIAFLIITIWSCCSYASTDSLVMQKNEWINFIKNRDASAISLGSFAKHYVPTKKHIHSYITLLRDENKIIRQFAAISLVAVSQKEQLKLADYNDWVKNATTYEKYDYLAPDTCQVWNVPPYFKDSSIAYGALPPKAISTAIKHKTVTETWYVLQGKGLLFLADQSNKPKVVKLHAGVKVKIPVNYDFQFRNTGKNKNLVMIIVGTPKWPGPNEAIKVKPYWKTKATIISSNN